EQLVANPAVVLESVCNKLGLKFEGGMLRSHSSTGSTRPGQFANNEAACKPVTGSSVGRWQSDLSREELRDVINVAGELLVTLGYTQERVPDADFSAESAISRQGQKQHQ
uniref:hypothetical protein n=1 Tax=Moorena producens TaxID=1155739 RepID=UPI0005C8736A